MSDIPHVGFIVAAYAITTVCLVGTVVALLIDNRAQKRLLARFADRRGDDA